MSTSSDKILFYGRPTDIDLVAAEAQFTFLENNNYSTDAEKIAYLLGRFRGPALVWAAQYLDGHPGLTADTYAQLLQKVKEDFGYDTKQSAAIARSQLSQLKQTRTLVEFFADFDSACLRADINADEPKIAMVLDKLKPRYRQVIIDAGTIYERYATLRKKLLNIAAMELQSVETELVQKAPSKTRRGGKASKGKNSGVKIDPKN